MVTLCNEHLSRLQKQNPASEAPVPHTCSFLHHCKVLAGRYHISARALQCACRPISHICPVPAISGQIQGYIPGLFKHEIYGRYFVTYNTPIMCLIYCHFISPVIKTEDFLGLKKCQMDLYLHGGVSVLSRKS